MRKRPASSKTVADVRGRVYDLVMAQNSSRLAKRAAAPAKRSSVANSGWPIRRAKSANCWALFVVKLTHPSAVGSMDGTSILRDDATMGGRPHAAANSANTDGNVTIPTDMQSKTATSTWAPVPVRVARHDADRAPMAA